MNLCGSGGRECPVGGYAGVNGAEDGVVLVEWASRPLVMADGRPKARPGSPFGEARMLGFSRMSSWAGGKNSKGLPRSLHAPRQNPSSSRPAIGFTPAASLLP